MKIVYLPYLIYSMKTTHTSSWYTKYTKCIATLIWIVIAFSSFWSAIDLYFSLPLSLQPWSFPISFWGGGNAFVGTLIISSQTAVTQQVQFADWTLVTCRRQIHWYYFNIARGTGLLPLSSSSNTAINGVNVNWWIYTSCGSGVRLYDLVWSISYTYNGGNMGSLYFWVQTDNINNTANWTYTPWAISWQVTNGINWRFFDTMFGIGTISSLGNLWGIGNLIGTFTNIYIQGQAGIGQSVSTDEREILTVNLAGTKTLLTSNDEAIASKVINTANQNMTRYCSEDFDPDNLTTQNIGNKKVVCINSENNTFVIDNSNFELLSNKDIVIKWGNVFLDKSIYNQDYQRRYLSLYIPNGHLIFDSNITRDWIKLIDQNGFQTTNSSQSVTQWAYIAGNFIVNGVILWSPNANLEDITTIPFKTYIHGRVASLNTMTTVSEKRESHLASLLENRNPNYNTLIEQWNKWYNNDKWDASLWSLFSWQCKDTDGASGGWGTPKWEFDAETVEIVVGTNCAIGHRYPLMIIERNIPSLFFN